MFKHQQQARCYYIKQQDWSDSLDTLNCGELQR